ncbi:hypothetical protein SDC9_145761 [bioreactor metagenome]|uniref:Uncharacterized protein n=1 Tax=bioreactor metagenome TaxID=1076179 RepID=A0A645ECU9_9ZZZZ
MTAAGCLWQPCRLLLLHKKAYQGLNRDAGDNFGGIFFRKLLGDFCDLGEIAAVGGEQHDIFEAVAYKGRNVIL